MIYEIDKKNIILGLMLMPNTTAPRRTKPSIQIQARDIETLRAIRRYRAMTTEQIEALLFNRWVDAQGTLHRRSPNPQRCSTQCSERLVGLYRKHLLYRKHQEQVPADGRKPMLYELDRKGAELLAGLDGQDPAKLGWKRDARYVTWFYLEHLIATNDVRLAVELSAREHGFDLVEWRDDTALRQAKRLYVTLEIRDARTRVAVIPDGFGVIRVGERPYPLFVEADRGTITEVASTPKKADMRQKVLAYRTLKASGLFQARFGYENFRVLTITTSDARLNNLVKVAEQAGGGFTFYFTTHDRIKRGRGLYSDALTEPIWRSPGRDGLRAVIPMPQPEQSDA